MRSILAISLGAIAGALSRYYVGIWLTSILGSTFPFATLLINLSGCFVMGFFVALTSRTTVTVQPDLRLLVTTGFLGSYTTFSSFQLDLSRLLENPLVLLYGVGNVGLGLLLLRAGSALAKKIIL